jgi:hypothetical protein
VRRGAFEHTFKERVIIVAVDAGADQHGPSTPKARLRTGGILSSVRFTRPISFNASAYFTVSTGPEGTADSRPYFSSFYLPTMS